MAVGKIDAAAVVEHPLTGGGAVASQARICVWAMSPQFNEPAYFTRKLDAWAMYSKPRAAAGSAPA